MDVRAIINAVWPDWELEKELGRGSFGVVYRAVRSGMKETYPAAIKVLSIPADPGEVTHLRAVGMNNRDLTTYYEEVVSDCVNEIAILEKLKGHSHIVSIEDFKVIRRREGFGWDVLIRMECLTSLPEYMSGGHSELPQEEVIRLGENLSEALSFCEKENVIHRDIKPANIFVASHGRFKLGDFGISRTLERTELSRSRKGTLNYMAPEVYWGDPYRTNVDVYSLGIVLYQLANHNFFPFIESKEAMLSRTACEAAFDRRMRSEPLPPPAAADPRLAEVILKACEYDIWKRYQNAEELSEALRALRKAPPASLFFGGTKDGETADVTVRIVPDPKIEKTGVHDLKKGNLVFGPRTASPEKKEKKAAERKNLIFGPKES